MAIREYPSLDGLALGELVRNREVTARELLEEAIDRVERHNAALNAVVYKFYDQARAAARNRQIGNAPFEGVPFLLKDILGDCEGVPTRYGSRYVPEIPAPADCELVARYKRSGFIPFGKTNVPEFGHVPITESQLYGPARNPWNLDRTPGGSSGGSAAAVAAGIVPVAHGNDGGGSIRIPASCCGLVGLKPTRGRISLAPTAGDIMNGLLAEHVLTRSVRDSAAALDGTAGTVPGDPYVAPPQTRPFLQEVSTPPKRLKIALSVKSLLGDSVHPDCVEAASHAAKLCADLGHDVQEDSPPIDFASLGPPFFAVWAAGAAFELSAAKVVIGREPTREELEGLTWNLYQLGMSITAGQYLLAVNTLQRLSRDFAKFFERYDLWLTPTLGLPPLKVGTVDLMSPTATMADETLGRFVNVNPLYNFSGQPAISLPLYWNREGLPIGVSFGAKFGDESTLFQISGQLERAQPWAGRKPPIWD
jgi:amidase